MERGDKNLLSLEKEKKTERSSLLSTGTPSNSVDKQESVDKLSTKRKYTCNRQRIRKDQLEKLNRIADKHGVRKFSEVIDILLSCYDFLEKVSTKYRISNLQATMSFIEKYLPANDFELIVSKVMELLDEVGINGKDRAVLEEAFIGILKSVKMNKKPAMEVLKLLLLMQRL